MKSTGRASLGLGLAALVLLLLPMVPEELTLAARALSVVAAYVLALAAWAAYVPVRVTLGIPRVLIILSVVYFGYLAATQSSALPNGWITFFMYSGFVLAVGPATSIPTRRWLYGSVVAWMWIGGLVAGLANWSTEGIFVKLEVFAVVCGITKWYESWLKSGRSTLVDAMETNRIRCRALFNTLRGRSSLRALFNGTKKGALCEALGEVARLAMTPQERYARMLILCRDFPQVRLAWQVAYWIAVEGGDVSEASKVAREARQVGFPLLPKHELYSASRPDCTDVWERWGDEDYTFRALQATIPAPHSTLVGAG